MLTPPPNIVTNDPHHTYGFRKCCEAVREAVPIEEVARRYTDLEPFGGQAWFTGGLKARTSVRLRLRSCGMRRHRWPR